MRQSDDLKLREVIDHLAQQINNEVFWWDFLCQPHIFVKSALTETEYFGQSNYVTQCFINDAFRAVCIWVNKNILLQLTKDTYITTNVKIRIATSMINKLVMQEKFSRDCGLLAHDILVSNIRELRGILDIEELPF
jgi:hypothetical protein